MYQIQAGYLPPPATARVFFRRAAMGRKRSVVTIYPILVWHLRIPASLTTGCICKPDDGIVAKRGQPLAPIRFHIPEAPAFAAIGVNEEVKTVTLEKLVGRSVGLADRHAVSVRRAVVRAIRVNPFIESTLSQALPLDRLAAVGFRRNAITKKPARRRVLRGFQRFW